jgi:hypothetical protein
MAVSREDRIEQRIDRLDEAYEDIVRYSTELAHYLESHSEHSYEGPLTASDLSLEDSRAEIRIEDVLEKLQDKRNNYDRLRGFLDHQLTRENDPVLRARFERRRWEAERYIHHRVEPITEDMDLS